MHDILPPIIRGSTAAPDPADTPLARMDRRLHVWQSRFTAGRSPSTVPLAWMDWAAHAGNMPFQMSGFLTTALTQWRRLAEALRNGEAAITPDADDHRFSHPDWQKQPYATLTQAVLLGEAWWASLIDFPTGVDRHNSRIVKFSLRQWLDMTLPSNMLWLNPEVVAATQRSGGANLVTGFQHFLAEKTADHPGSEARAGFTVGVDLAATPGQIVFRNDMMELIQYSTRTSDVSEQPVLIVPAWIMKYYILDLSAHNSLVRWLVGQGHTVFMVSWRNPDAGMRNIGMDDYRQAGVMAAIDAIGLINGPARIHATGYCLGGTLLTIAAAAMARDGDHRLSSLTLFAAQTDFTEAGELQLFITDDQLDFLNEIMQSQGYLDSSQMSGAFQMLRSNDLVWSHAIHDYLLGEQDTPSDLMAWNADGTRLPARMHIDYLRHLFLNNELAEGRYLMDGRPLALDDIKLPIFMVGTERDHIAPWHSVYKLTLLNDGDITFVLTSGGHNAGIVSEPGHPHRHFRLHQRRHGGRTLGPDEWMNDTAIQSGSWWPAWGAWLNHHSLGRRPAPMLGIPGHATLDAAPGRYVLEG